MAVGAAMGSAPMAGIPPGRLLREPVAKPNASVRTEAFERLRAHFERRGTAWELGPYPERLAAADEDRDRATTDGPPLHPFFERPASRLELALGRH